MTSPSLSTCTHAFMRSALELHLGLLPTSRKVVKQTRLMQSKSLGLLRLPSELRCTLVLQRNLTSSRRSQLTLSNPSRGREVGLDDILARARELARARAANSQESHGGSTHARSDPQPNNGNAANAGLNRPKPAQEQGSGVAQKHLELTGEAQGPLQNTGVVSKLLEIERRKAAATRKNEANRKRNERRYERRAERAAGVSDPESTVWEADNATQQDVSEDRSAKEEVGTAPTGRQAKRRDFIARMKASNARMRALKRNGSLVPEAANATGQQRQSPRSFSTVIEPYSVQVFSSPEAHSKINSRSMTSVSDAYNHDSHVKDSRARRITALGESHSVEVHKPRKESSRQVYQRLRLEQYRKNRERFLRKRGRYMQNLQVCVQYLMERDRYLLERELFCHILAIIRKLFRQERPSECKQSRKLEGPIREIKIWEFDPARRHRHEERPIDIIERDPFPELPDIRGSQHKSLEDANLVSKPMDSHTLDGSGQLPPWIRPTPTPVSRIVQRNPKLSSAQQGHLNRVIAQGKLNEVPGANASPFNIPKTSSESSEYVAFDKLDVSKLLQDIDSTLKSWHGKPSSSFSSQSSSGRVGIRQKDPASKLLQGIDSTLTSWRENWHGKPSRSLPSDSSSGHIGIPQRVTPSKQHLRGMATKAGQSPETDGQGQGQNEKPNRESAVRDEKPPKPEESSTASAENEPKKKTIADMDRELQQKMAGHAGDGGEAGVEYENGEPVAMKRGVKNNMFRYI